MKSIFAKKKSFLKIKHKRKQYILTAVGIFFLFVVGYLIKIYSQPPGSIPFQVIKQENTSIMDSSLYIVSKKDDLTKLPLFSDDNNTSALEKLSTVDFNRDIAVVITGIRSIESIIVSFDTVKIYEKYEKRPEGTQIQMLILSSYIIVTIPKEKLPLAFPTRWELYSAYKPAYGYSPERFRKLKATTIYSSK